MLDTGEMTIDELAHRVGMTARNVRAHQSRGLLPPPKIRGRTGYYGPEHVARLELVRDLQAEGFNLESIRRILERTTATSVTDVLDFTRAVAEPFSDEEPEMVDLEELRQRWGDQLTPKLAARAAELGFAKPLDDRHAEILSPRLRRASEELAELGVPLSTALDLIEKLRRHTEPVANAYVDLFVKTVWEPFQKAGEPEESWGEVRDALERLRPLAVESLAAMFGIVMTETVEKALARELKRASR
jgi:DNA-binding transcriptional MerR regulator